MSQAVEAIEKLIHECRINGAIFDMDGTLIDSMPVWNQAGECYLKSLGFKPKAGLGEKLREMNMGQGCLYVIEQYHSNMSLGDVTKGVNDTIYIMLMQRVFL